MSIYNAKPSPPEGRQITFPDSIQFIIEAIHLGSVIFDETGELRALVSAGSALRKNTHLLGHLSPFCDQNTSRAPYFFLAPVQVLYFGIEFSED